MIDEKEFEGSTVEEAKEAAAEDLGVSADDLEVENIEEEKGLFGFGTKKVKLTVKTKEEWTTKAKDFLEKVLPHISTGYQIEFAEDEDNNLVSISGDDVGLAIGRHGKTIEALQLLLNIAVNKDFEEKKRIILDIENYRQKRIASLERIARDYAAMASEENKPITLEPMNAFERKIIHTTLSDNPAIETKSEGEDPFRKVVIYPQ